MNSPTLDLQPQFAAIEADVRAAIDRVLTSQRFIGGPEITALEEEVAAYCGCTHGIGVSSGTDALLVALMALGVGPGDEVITTPYTFFATAGTIHRLGATPVFVDIDPVTYNIDAAGIEARITKRTRAILPVHLFGRCADMRPILEIAEAHELPVVEDAAQSIGATQDGRLACSMGAMGCLSFFPSKNLGGIGDGGMVVTRNAELADRVALLRGHGAKPKYYHHHVGGNFRIDAINAAVLRVKLAHLDRWHEGRAQVAARYTTLLDEARVVAHEGPITAVPFPDPLGRQVFNQYVIRARRRDELQAFLAQRDIATAVYYPLPLHLQPCFAGLGLVEGDLPVSEQASRETLALPMYPELPEEHQRAVVEGIAAFFNGTP